MATVECPRIRRGLAAVPDHSDPRYVFVFDQFRISNRPQRFSLAEFGWLQMFDGRRTLRDIQAEAIRQVGGQLLPLEVFSRLVARLDDALLLDGPRLREFLASPVREPSCLGCYAAEPDALGRQLERLFTGPNGPGLPNRRPADKSLYAALLPHIDYHRGGVTFAWGFKEVVEHSNASLFVIIGTSHYSGERFSLTRKDFRTPLGVTRTDQHYIDRLVGHYGPGLFDDELAHVPEHSIELEVVFLEYLLGSRRSIRIVPLVVGTFQDVVDSGQSPSATDDIGRMIAALRRCEEETKEPICYIISGDLAHLGPKFGAEPPVEEPVLRHSREQDQLLLRRAETGDLAGYFRVIADEGDRRRICGLPPTYTLLDAIRPSHGKVLHYDQYVHPRGFESVSFASMAFYR
jgi:AmmeMemoRadiSam system protein B